MRPEEIHILLVEDNPGDARLIVETLRDTDSLRCRLSQAERLERMREILAAETVDVVLLDLSLPDAHGLETLTRTIEAAPRVPIVVLTGLDDERVALQAVQAGAQDYLVKGQVDSGLLVRSLRYAMERKRLELERGALLDREKELRAIAEAAVRARDEVLRIVSHDLGNSLSAVGIHAKLLERLQPEAVTPEAVYPRARMIRSLVEQMHRLRQDLLDAASIEAGRLSMHPAPQDVGEIAREVVETVAELTAERSLTLQVEVPEGLPSAKADRQRLLQVLHNLLGNAAKFTPPGGRITLRARLEEDSVCFSVEDTGPGIPPEHLENVFERFWRGGGTDRKGAGLGLAIARGIVEAHGGRIWAESTEAVGSVFSFTIPLTGSTSGE